MGLHRGRCTLISAVLCLAVVAARADEPQFADLLARAHAQAAAGHYWQPVGDNAMDTFRLMASHLSEATPAQLTAFNALLTAVLRAKYDEAATPDSKLFERTPGAPGSPVAQGGQPAPYVQQQQDASVARIPKTPTRTTTDPEAGAVEARAAGASRITALLQQADQQIAAGHTYWPLGDNALGSLELVLSLLPQATSSESKAFRDLPAHFRSRAQEASAAGNVEQAEDYRQIADAMSGSAAAASSSTTASALPDHTAGPRPRLTVDERPTLSTGSASGPGEATDDSEPLRPRRQRPDEGPRPETRPRVSSIVVNAPQPSARPGSPVMRSPADARCRALVQRMQIGEDLPDADRAYLRRGCP